MRINLLLRDYWRLDFYAEDQLLLGFAYRHSIEEKNIELSNLRLHLGPFTLLLTWVTGVVVEDVKNG